jgi:hypothetical protein
LLGGTRRERTLELLTSFEAFDHVFSRSGLSSRKAADELWQQAEASLLAVPSA